MNQKDLIKYGLLALGAYLIYRYIQDHGGIEGLFGPTSSPVPGIVPPATTGTPGTPAVYPTGPRVESPSWRPPVLDMAGLVVTPDENKSLSGTVKINGVPVRLSIITADGRIFDATGQEVTASVQASGVDIVALRTAFANAPVDYTGRNLIGAEYGSTLTGLGRWTPPWLVN